MSAKTAVIVASRENPLTILKDELVGRGLAVKVFFREDVKGYESLEKAAEESFKEFGKVDYLVISSLQDKSIYARTIDSLTEEEYADWKYYSLKQFFDLNRTFVKRMVSAGGGVVFGFCSQAAATPAVDEGFNGASGASLMMGLKCLAEESEEDGIYTNAVAIGATEENEDFAPATLNAEMVKHIPAGYVMTPEEAAKKAADIMLITDRAFTGNLLSIDAAFSCAYMREW